MSGLTHRDAAMLSAAPATFAALFALRALRPVVDTTLVGILVAIVVCVVGLFLGRRWAAVTFLVFPVALIVSPAARDLSFSLVSPDSTAWRLHAIASLVTAGLSVASCATMLLVTTLVRPAGSGGRGSPVGGRVVAVGTLGGSMLGVGMIGLVQLVSPVQVYGAGLDAAERDALPKVALVNFAYAPLDLEVDRDGVTRFLLVNPSDLPHTLTIDTGGPVDVDVYVPARREVVVEIEGSSVPGSEVAFFCGIGDHAEQGMVGRVVVLDG